MYKHFTCWISKNEYIFTAHDLGAPALRKLKINMFSNKFGNYSIGSSYQGIVCIAGSSILGLREVLFVGVISYYAVHASGLILGLRPANERRRCFVTTSVIGWVQA